METLAEKAKREAFASGYVKDPNNIFALPGIGLYAGGPGKPEFRALSCYVRIESVEPAPGQIPQDLWPVALYVNVYGGRVAPVLVRRFETWGAYMDFCKEYGTPSRPGLPAFLHGD